MWLLVVVAKEYGVLPSIVARALDRDPEQLDLASIPLLRYSEAKAAFERNNTEEMKRFNGSWYMEQVVNNAFSKAERELEERDGDD